MSRSHGAGNEMSDRLEKEAAEPTTRCTGMNVRPDMEKPGGVEDQSRVFVIGKQLLYLALFKLSERRKGQWVLPTREDSIGSRNVKWKRQRKAKVTFVRRDDSFQ